jgi:hypothetical protein
VLDRSRANRATTINSLAERDMVSPPFFCAIDLDSLFRDCRKPRRSSAASGLHPATSGSFGWGWMPAGFLCVARRRKMDDDPIPAAEGSVPGLTWEIGMCHNRVREEDHVSSSAACRIPSRAFAGLRNGCRPTTWKSWVQRGRQDLGLLSPSRAYSDSATRLLYHPHPRTAANADTGRLCASGHVADDRR